MNIRIMAAALAVAGGAFWALSPKAEVEEAGLTAPGGEVEVQKKSGGISGGVGAGGPKENSLQSQMQQEN
jgi:hypothetical protein